MAKYVEDSVWIPACAGMTVVGARMAVVKCELGDMHKGRFSHVFTVLFTSFIFAISSG